MLYWAHRSGMTCSKSQVIPNNVSDVWRFTESPIEFKAELSNARIARIGDNPEACAVNVPTRVHELRMVEDVEKFDTEIERIVLMDHGSLRKAEIGVVEARAVEEPTVGGAESS